MRLKFTLVMLAFSLLLLGLPLAGCDDNSAANMAAAKQKCFNDCNQDAQKAQQNNETVPDCAKDCEDGVYKNPAVQVGDASDNGQNGQGASPSSAN